MTEFVKLSEVPKSLENTIENFRAGIAIDGIDKDYDFWGQVYVSKLDDERVVPASQRRIWTPKWTNPFHYDLKDVPEEVVRDELEKYRTAENIWVTQGTTQYVVDKANAQLAGKYNLALPPADFVALLDPVVQKYLSIKEAGLKVKPRLEVV